MGFLLRLAFLVGLVLLILPMPADEPAGAGAHAAPATSGPPVFAAFGLAQTAVSDLAGFCGRNPGACETGARLASSLRERATYGARLVYEQLAEPEAEMAGAPTPAESLDAPAAAAPVAQPTLAPGGTDTLSASDREIAWHGTPAQ